MTGLVEWTEKAGRDRKPVAELTLCGMRFARAELVRSRWTPEQLVAFRCVRTAGRLRRAGITRAVFPEQFGAYETVFRERGIRPVETLPLFRALTTELTRYAVEANHIQSASIAVVGDRMSAELTRCVTALCLRYRYVQLDVPAGGEALARSLRRSMGVPLVTASSRRQLEQADVLILFADRSDLSRNNPVVLPLYSETALPPLPPLPLPALEIPAGCQRTQFLAALWAAGILRIPGTL